jgi:protease II
MPQEVLLDSKYLRMTNLSIRKVLLSPDHNLFAYQTEREGAEVGNLHFKDLTGVKDLKVGFSAIVLPQIALAGIIKAITFCREMYWKMYSTTSGPMTTRQYITLLLANSFGQIRCPLHLPGTFIVVSNSNVGIFERCMHI